MVSQPRPGAAILGLSTGWPRGVSRSRLPSATRTSETRVIANELALAPGLDPACTSECTRDTLSTRPAGSPECRCAVTEHSTDGTTSVPAASLTARYLSNAGAGAGGSKATTKGRSSGPRAPVGCSQKSAVTDSPGSIVSHALGAYTKPSKLAGDDATGPAARLLGGPPGLGLDGGSSVSLASPSANDPRAESVPGVVDADQPPPLSNSPNAESSAGTQTPPPGRRTLTRRATGPPAWDSLLTRS
mmetsp:Transcript_6592/g.26824  ORF Transcript_6592/g.26824 Transcript_6592/m.26824 type:complete len:245 (+) Transcript_6592:1858-2592(+)